ncbi:MAG TPA: hypothetical protein VK459_11995 [Polyangiaceae bacterium]|nr:hypothetical protein [Polyangiaceae bacterium]
MSRATTDALRQIPSSGDLARAIRERIQGTGGDRPGYDDWTWTDAVFRAAELAVGDELVRLKEALKQLLLDLVEQPDKDLEKGEWPSGLFRVLRRAAWTPSEREVLRRHLAGLVIHADAWPLGKEAAAQLGSPVVELLRSARWADVPALTMRPVLDQCMERLLAEQRDDADPELGTVVGIRTSYGAANDLAVLRRLRELPRDRRDRILFWIDREYSMWAKRPATDLGQPFLQEYDSNQLRILAGSPSIDDQQWAGEAVLRFGDPEDAYVTRTAERFCRPAPTDQYAKVARPSLPARAASGR